MNRLLKQTALPLACAATLTWMATPAALAKDEAPFTGYFNTVHHDTLDFDPVLGPIIAVQVEGQGILSHLGTASCFTEDQLAILGTGVVLATYTYTAANGDTILLDTVSQLVGFDPVAQRVNFIGHFEVLDGTGRFAGVTGSGEISGWAVFDEPFGSPVNSGPGFFEFDGVISTARVGIE